MADDNPHYRGASCEFPLFFLALAKIRVTINDCQFGGFSTCAATKPIKRFVEKIQEGKKGGKMKRTHLIALVAFLVFVVSYLLPIDVFGSARSVEDLSVDPSSFNSSPSVPDGLEPRLPASKPKIIKVPEKGVYKDIVIVKLVEDSKVRLRGGIFVSLNPSLHSDFNTSLTSLKNLLHRPEIKQVERHFTRPESELDVEKERGERLSQKQLADLNLYYEIHLVSGVDPEPILTMLNALDIVEIAYLPPIPEPAILDPNENQPLNSEPITGPLLTSLMTDQTELITNGSFSSGTSWWTLWGDFWAGTNLTNYRTSPGYAAGGVDSSGIPKNSAIGYMYQTVNIPSSATSVTLTFWYNITSQETGTTPYDVLNVTIQDSTGGYLAPVAVYSNVNKDPAPGNPYYHQKSFDMTPYKGRTVRVNFLGTTNGNLPTTFRIDDVSMVALMPGVLSVTPSDGLTSSGNQGGPFIPSSKIYTLANTGGSSINWTASKGQSWVSLSLTSGTLAAGANTTVMVSINSSANSLTPDPYSDTISFINTTNGNGNTTRPVSLTVNPITPTPNFQSQQGYLNNTDIGVHALYGWTQAGGTGTGIKIIDIEGGWQTTHEDFPTPFIPIDGTNSTDPMWRHHGTAVIGQMVAKNNGIGVTGIAYDAQYSAVSIFTYSTADAINRASSNISSGDIILIELQAYQGFSSGLTCDSTCMVCPPDNQSRFEYIPMEYWLANYDAIRTATANGRIVVEAGGNGSMNLDSPIYGGAFDRNQRDSGAILVGAGVSTNRNPQCWTNYGSRVDIQGWGNSVVTTGYGNLLFDGSGNPDRYYTDSFSGTSSASPIVAGSAATIQGRNKVISGGGVLSPLAMRSLLRNTGTAQGTGGDWGFKQIGPLPNIEAAIQVILPTGNLQVTLGPSGAVSAGAQWNVDGGGWQNSGATVTGLSVGSHTVNYKSITGWNAPSSESVTINNGLTTSISRNYTQQTGNLQVTLGPSGAVSAGAQWNVDGGGWQNSGATVTGLSVGSHTVNYKSITGWNAPSSEQVNINSGQTTQITSNYEQISLRPMTVDLNNDGIPNFYDFSVFATFWQNASCSPPNWCNGSDFDKNGIVDIYDLQIFAEFWLWPVADVDLDGAVNFTDYAIFAYNWMDDTCCDPNWCEGTDFDQSGVVNFIDFGILAEYWLWQPVGYSIIDLGTLGGDESESRSINNNGQIVGWAQTASGEIHATLFDSTGLGDNVDLGTLGGDDSRATSINDTGQIVGEAHIGGYPRAILFDPTGGGNNIDLGTLGGTHGSALSINESAQIVGFASPTSPISWHATVFDPSGNGNNVALDAPGQYYSSFAFSINNNGQIVGHAFPTGPAHCCALLFDSTGAGNNVDLGTLADYPSSKACSINDNGEIVGFVYIEYETGHPRAVLFDSTGSGNNIDLGTLGGDESRAYSINDNGQVVGWAEDASGDTHATLFDPTGDGNNINLNGLIDPASGWELSLAIDINNSGQIVGHGRNPDGDTHAFLLVPLFP